MLACFLSTPAKVKSKQLEQQSEDGNEADAKLIKKNIEENFLMDEEEKKLEQLTYSKLMCTARVIFASLSGVMI